MKENTKKIKGKTGTEIVGEDGKGNFKKISDKKSGNLFIRWNESK